MKNIDSLIKKKTLASIQQAYNSMKILSTVRMKQMSQVKNNIALYMQYINGIYGVLSHKKSTGNVAVILFCPKRLLCNEFFKNLCNGFYELEKILHSTENISLFLVGEKKENAMFFLSRLDIKKKYKSIETIDFHHCYNKLYDGKLNIIGIFALDGKVLYWSIGSKCTNYMDQKNFIFQRNFANTYFFGNYANNEIEKLFFSRRIDLENYFIQDNILSKIRNSFISMALQYMFFSTMFHEHRERVQTAERALKNIKDMLKTLENQITRIKQNRITNELTSIVSIREVL